MPSVDQHLDELTVACQHLIETIGDLRVRGHIKEHPAFIEHSAELIEGMLVEIGRGVVEAKCTTVLPQLPEVEVARQHQERAAEYGAHRCRCGWCLHAV